MRRIMRHGHWLFYFGLLLKGWTSHNQRGIFWRAIRNIRQVLGLATSLRNLIMSMLTNGQQTTATNWTSQDLRVFPWKELPMSISSATLVSIERSVAKEFDHIGSLPVHRHHIRILSQVCIPARDWVCNGSLKIIVKWTGVHESSICT